MTCVYMYFTESDSDSISVCYDDVITIGLSGSSDVVFLSQEEFDSNLSNDRLSSTKYQFFFFLFRFFKRYIYIKIRSSRAWHDD